METLNIEEKLSRDLNFVKGIVKAVSLLISPISEGLGNKSRKKIAVEIKKELDHYVEKYLNIFLDLAKRYNYLLENPDEVSRVLSLEEYESRIRDMEKGFRMVKENLEEIQGVYKLISTLVGEDIAPDELNSMIEDINWILANKNWANQDDIKKSEEDYNAGRFIVV
jgi:hypothetical protein